MLKFGSGTRFSPYVTPDSSEECAAYREATEFWFLKRSRYTARFHKTATRPDEVSKFSFYIISILYILDD